MKILYRITVFIYTFITTLACLFVIQDHFKDDLYCGGEITESGKTIIICITK